MKKILIEEKKSGRQHVVTDEAWLKMKEEFGTAHKYRVLDENYQQSSAPTEVKTELKRRKKDDQNDTGDNTEADEEKQ